MELALLTLDVEHLQDVNRCDSSFTVASKLILNAQNGEIGYQIVSVPAYQKRYPVDVLDAITYIDNPDKVIFLAYLDGQIAGQIRWAKARGFPGIMLETQNNNVAACRLYERTGMQLGGFDKYLYKGITPDTEEIALYWYLIF
ncbi:MAG: acetyltransferase [Chloroflexi bacterium]|nr:acetyltransferase [Chloroflexota bacterium]